MGAIAGELLDDISARFTARDSEGAVGRGAVGADDRAAGAAGVTREIPHLEHRALNGLLRVDAVVLPHDDSGVGTVIDAEGVSLAGRDEYLLLAGFRQAEPLRRLQFLDPEPAIPKGNIRITENDASLFIRVKHAQVVVLSGGCVVAGVPDLHGDIGERIMGDLVFLDDLDGGPLMILKVYVPISVGIERNQLGFLRQQIGLRHRLFDDLYHAGQQIFHHGDAVFIGFRLGNGMAVCALHEEDGMGDRLSAVRVPLMDDQIGAFFIGQGDRAGPPGEQFHMILLGIQNVVFQSGLLFYGVYPRLQVRD